MLCVVCVVSSVNEVNKNEKKKRKCIGQMISCLSKDKEKGINSAVILRAKITMDHLRNVIPRKAMGDHARQRKFF